MSVVSPNPTLSRLRDEPVGFTVERMTLRGTVAKTALSLAVVAAAAAVAWSANLGSFVVIALVLATFIAGLVISFKPHLARVLTLPYAAAQGAAVGTISRWYADGAVIDGASGVSLVWAALGLTLGVAVALLTLYSTGKIKPSANFKLGVAAACGGVALFYLATIGLRMFGIDMPLVHSNSNWGILFSVAVVCLASACLVTDFDFIETAVEQGAPKHMEWYGAFALTVTLVWLYLELLRLLAKVQSRR